MRVKVYRVRVRVYRVSKRPSRAFLKMQTPAPPLSRPRRNLPETVVEVGSGLAAGGTNWHHGLSSAATVPLLGHHPYWATTMAPRVPLADKEARPLLVRWSAPKARARWYPWRPANFCPNPNPNPNPANFCHAGICRTM